MKPVGLLPLSCLTGSLRLLEIDSWRARPGPLNTARPLNATIELVPSKFLENLDFDQKYL